MGGLGVSLTTVRVGTDVLHHGLPAHPAPSPLGLPRHSWLLEVGGFTSLEVMEVVVEVVMVARVVVERRVLRLGVAGGGRLAGPAVGAVLTAVCSWSCS